MSLGKIKVLLVEDDEILSEMYRTKFEHDGFEVVVAHDGQEALDKIKTPGLRVVLLDIIMPKVDGFAVLEKIKQDPSIQNLPVIMLTNLGQDEDIDKGKKLGAIAYLVKANLTPQQVVDKVKKVLKIE